MNVDQEYAKLIADVVTTGDDIVTRNSRVKRLMAVKVVFDSTPLVSVRRTPWRLSLREMQWVLSGSSNINDLHESVRHWWRPWARESDGVIYGNYGQQLRRWSRDDGSPFDQLAAFVAGVRDHPSSRRNLLTTWNAADMADELCPITNCWGTVIQAFVGGDGLLSLVTYQRSADVICGLPSNWIQMAAFHLWLSSQVGRRIGKLTWIGGDVHVYRAHFDLADRIVGHAWKCPPTPTLTYTTNNDEFVADDFSLDGEYRPVLEEKAEMII